jgi:hypothetical protein
MNELVNEIINEISKRIPNNKIDYLHSIDNHILGVDYNKNLISIDPYDFLLNQKINLDFLINDYGLKYIGKSRIDGNIVYQIEKEKLILIERKRKISKIRKKK